jgi:hypothetical protein
MFVFDDKLSTLHLPPPSQHVAKDVAAESSGIKFQNSLRLQYSEKGGKRRDSSALCSTLLISFFARHLDADFLSLIINKLTNGSAKFVN